MSFNGAAVAISFWIFITVVSVAGMVQDYRKRKLALEPLRIAIEHGHPLPAEIVTRLLGQDAQSDKVDPQHLQTGGIITVAAGIGVGLLSLFVAQVKPLAMYPIMGGGVVAICVGIGLMLAANSMRRNLTADSRGRVA